jgi:hypothetical protein
MERFKMAFCWVNQNKTYDQEVGGGYMWSPKRNSNGAYNQFYENMALVQPGDVVFSFRKQKISDVGVIQASGISGRKPKEFGSKGEQWSDEGWLVPVNWFSLEYPVRPQEYIEEIRPTLPEKYAPLRADTGGGKELYLTHVPEAMAAILIGKLRDKDRHLIEKAETFVTGEQELQDTQTDEIQLNIEQNTNIDQTEIEAIVKSRRGQGRYRRNLELIENSCRVTGVTDKRLLRASHIKPWRLCENNHERLDGNNGLLLTPSIDLLFDQGYISFNDDGSLLVSTQVADDQLAAIHLPIEREFTAGTFSIVQCLYLAFHRKNVFRA